MSAFTDQRTRQARGGVLPVIVVWLCFLAALLPYRFNRTDFLLLAYASAAAGIMLGAMYFLTSPYVRRVAAKVAKESPHFLAYCFLLLMSQSVTVLGNPDFRYIDLVWVYGYVGLAVLSFLVLAVALSDGRWLETLFYVWLLIGVLIAVPALVVAVTGALSFLGIPIRVVNSPSLVDFNVSSSLLYSGNRSALVCFFGLISALYLIAVGKHRLFAMSGALLCGGAIVVFWSRSIYLATFVALASWLVLISRRTWRPWIIGALTTVGVVAVLFVLSNDFFYAVFLRQGLNTREVLWPGAIEAMLEKPWMGYGLGPSTSVDRILYEHTGIGTEIHNGFIAMALRAGMPAALTYILIMVFSLRRMWTASSWSQTARTTISALILGSAVAVFFVDYSVGGAGYGALVISVILGIANAAPWSRSNVQARGLAVLRA